MNKQQGFTILELMIASTVLATMLLLATTAMIGVGNLYYKGLTQSRVQANARDITNEIGQHLQLSDKAPDVAPPATVGPNTVYAYCFADVRYSYVLHQRVGNDVSHVLWRDDTPSAGCTPNTTILASPSGGTELVTNGARLTAFSITGSSPFQVKVGVAYGDPDLLCDTNTVGNCAAAASVMALTAAQWNNANIICKSIAGQHFCAAARLDTTVVKRLNGS